MYTIEQINNAVNVFNELGHYRATIEELGYPTLGVLWQWVHGNIPKKCLLAGKIKNRNYNNGKYKTYRWDSSVLNKKLKAVRMAEKGIDLEDISSALNGTSSTTIKTWIRQYKNGEIMKDIPKIPVEGDGPIFEGVTDPEETIRLLKLENDIYRGLVDILKVHSLENLPNSAKTMLIDYLRQEKSIPLKELTDFLKISKSSYSYQHHAMQRPDKYADITPVIINIFNDYNQTRGYRFITQELRNLDEPIVISEKIVRRIMREENLNVIYNKRKRNFSSYAGEISEAPDNLVKRNFHANKPNELWLSDITQFTLPDYKVYLSPVIDCYDGKAIGFDISQHPNADLANTSLKKAIDQLRDGETPICHTDRGGHYRWPGWIKLCEDNNIIRSMSKKACSPDNSACEGFFGRLKNEFFYYRDWRNVTYDEFKRKLTEYICYYNERRKKESLGWLSPNDYRRKFLKVA